MNQKIFFYIDLILKSFEDISNFDDMKKIFKK